MDARPPPVSALTRTADAIVVLTGGSKRLETGFDLLEAGIAKKLFISGVYRGVEVKELLNQWKKESQSHLDCCVELGFEADDTIGNAKETIKWLEQQGYHSIYLVTANYHMKRAMKDFETFDPDIEIIPYPVLPEGPDMKDWWRDTTYRSLILREYMKYMATVVWSFMARSL
jgi:uncharacterized SAM-binding protein YcdF (DUF218 family)